MVTKMVSGSSTLIVVSALLLLFCHDSQGITQSKQCKFPGYAPGGIVPKMRDIDIKPTTFEKSMMQNSLKFLAGKIGTTDDKLHTAVESAFRIFESAPVIGSVVTIIGTSFDIAVDEKDPDEILRKAQESVLLLQDEVNKRLDQMVDYVDAKDLEGEKRAMKNTYKELFDKWSKCARKSSKNEVDRCQKNTEEDIDSARFHFQQKQSMFDQTKKGSKRKYDPNFRYRYVATWQWMDRYCGTHAFCPSHYDVKLIESGLVIFRDYASLHLLSIAALAGTYKLDKATNAESCKQYQHYMDKLEKKANYYVEYVKWAYDWIYIRQYEENMYFGVPRRSGGPASAKRGGFIGTIECPSSSKCTVECSQMIKDNKCTLSGAHKATLMTEAGKVCDKYLYSGPENMKKAIQEYWTTDVLDVAKIWEQYRDSAKNPTC